MAKIIAVANQKGGVGKTTLALNFGASLVKMGKKVCLVDCDPQANMTMGLGYLQPDELPITMPDIVQEIIILGANENKSELLNNREYILKGKEVDLIPSSIKLATVESQLNSAISRENVLKKLIRRIQHDYDFILLDTMPSLSIMTINALVASDEVLIPVQPQFFSAKGLELLFETIEHIKGELNPNLKIAGVLVTMYSDRINIHKEIVKVIEEAFERHLRIFNTKIPVSIKATESQTLSISVFEHDPSSKLAESYSLFTNEFLCGK
jgi:chromosome partitioning protein